MDLSAQSLVPPAPKLNLTSYILIEASTNTVIAEFNSDNQIAPASMTKVMSGYVIADQIANGSMEELAQVMFEREAASNDQRGVLDGVYYNTPPP